MGLPKTPSLSALPAAPPPAPLLPDSFSGSASLQAVNARQAAGQYGMDGTILTSATGTAAPATAGKPLFGN